MFGLFTASLEEAKEFLLSKLKPHEYKITIDSDKFFEIEIPIKSRAVSLKLSEFKKGSITVDVIDPFGMIRIPRKVFNKQEKLQIFLLDSLRNILINSKLT